MGWGSVLLNMVWEGFFFLKLVFSKKRNSFFHKTYRDILLNFFQFLCILNIQVFSLPNRFLRCKFLKKNVTLSKNLMITELNKQILILFQISVAPSHQKSDFRAINFFPHFHRNFFIFMFNTSVYCFINFKPRMPKFIIKFKIAKFLCKLLEIILLLFLQINYNIYNFTSTPQNLIFKYLKKNNSCKI